KPVGITSHDLVKQVRRVYGIRQVGHGGTLDPLAAGVLPVAVGRATRLLSFLQGDKGYEATFRWGQRSRTDDVTGEITWSQPCPELTLEQIRAVLPEFVGTIWQRPPDYSAIRHQGKRLYELARAGESLAVAPRPVTITRLEILAWRPGDFPELDLSITCGPGTYIRALARDMGDRLGCGGLMTALLRTASQGFSLQDSRPLNSGAPLLPLWWPFRDCPRVFVDGEGRQRWQWGQRLSLDHPDSDLVTVWDGEGGVWGLGRVGGGVLQPLRVLADGQT
ncbi:MAG: tRNA pseudouridine(55) synthase TruB, partial [Thermostichales cyanobacterium BF4_bins_65]